MGNIKNKQNFEGEFYFADREWQRKTCQHIIRMIKDEQMLLEEALHPEVVASTLEVIYMAIKYGEGKGDPINS